MDRENVERVIALFAGRDQLDRIDHADEAAARACFNRATDRVKAATVLAEAELWESAFTTAYDAYRTAADAIVLKLGYRVPATQGGHRIATDIGHAAIQHASDAYAPASAERIRQGRHESEYFDPARPVDKTSGDAHWAIELARSAVTAVETELSAG